ncbi:adenylate/guanylate cyclase domain-containing protein [Rubripirellula reticaptiva]|uniref:Adenylate cyclase 2 n=1 Tax=Rubripirellula reticaptiva TaxID=2528013 RepID=A0A5C6FA33_9BACT|nr:adenylate/guanylate cyclase domain-containing protein [Rubripirellula reticaptiva]TWU58238.1 Adenylate cyclase 2 [Rubripirellula reticaptiva]
MPDLIAQGPNAKDRWRRELPAPTSRVDIVVGRAESDWNVPWDGAISRSHVRIRSLAGDRIEVHKIKGSRNPVYHQGQQSESFTVVAGDHFVIGQTTFTLVNRPGTAGASAASGSSGKPGDVTEHAFDHQMLSRRHFRDSASRIEMLSRLPDLILGSHSDEELLVRVTGVLLQATPSASAVAIVAVDADSDNVNILHYDNRSLGRVETPVSERLVHSATHKRESVLHLWSAGAAEMAAFTAADEVDWAFCVPLRSEACPGWAIYVTGQLVSESGLDIGQSMQEAPDDLEDDVKFAELVGTTIANLRQSRRLQRRQTELRHFFAPVVMEAMAGRDPDEVLKPREADLSVMFCDLRGFSRASERDSSDLLDLLARVSDALGVMTRRILDSGGVIGDFHGDAAMGFWGWPLNQDDSAIRAATAASLIRSDYRRQADAGGFRCGIGIATGRAVAGRIGTVDQVKVTAFGPVVNLSSRLEGITKAFGAEIVIDQATADAIAASSEKRFRVRRLATVRPAGFQNSVQVCELLNVDEANSPLLSDEQIAIYESSLDALIEGNWDQAYEMLHGLPVWDRPKDALLSTILKHNRTAPQGWDGIIDMPKL